MTQSESYITTISLYSRQAPSGVGERVFDYPYTVVGMLMWGDLSKKSMSL
jgi:hypothetical protein